MSDPQTPAGSSESENVQPGARDAAERAQSSGATTGNGLDRSEPARPKREIDLAAFRRGEGFEIVLMEFGPMIHSVAHRYAEDIDEEEDLYQEACVRIWEGRETFREGCAFRVDLPNCGPLVPQPGLGWEVKAGGGRAVRRRQPEWCPALRGVGRPMETHARSGSPGAHHTGARPAR